MSNDHLKEAIKEEQSVNKLIIETKTSAIDEQQEKLEAFKKRVYQAQYKELDPELIKFKIKNVEEQMEALMVSLHYANQELSHFETNMIIDGRLKTAKEVVEGMNKEMHDLRLERSLLNGML